MTNTEGVTAEVAVDAAETPEVQDEAPKAEEPTEEPSNDDAPEESPVESLTDEEREELKKDPKIKALLEAEVSKAKGRQKAALRQGNEKIVEQQKEIAQQREALETLQQQYKELHEKQLDPSDFDTDEEYEEAKADKRLEEKLMKRELDDKDAELIAKQQEQFNEANTRVMDNIEAVKAEIPEIAESVQKMAQEAVAFKQAYPNDKGMQAFENYFTYEAENPAKLAHEYATNKDFKYSLFGKPDFVIKEILREKDQSFNQPKEIKSDPLPKPLSKTKGAAVPKDLGKGSVLSNLGLK